MPKRPVARLSAALMFGLCATAHAQVQHVHVHGQAFMDLAVDGERVEIELRAPAHDLVGFERQPANAEERAKELEARRAMLDHANLWQFSVAAGCVAETPTLEVPGTAGKDHDHDHDHDHGHDHGDGHEHSDWIARYAFRCGNPTALRAIDTGLFERFPSLQAITVQVIDARGARGETLTPTARRIVLTP